MVDLHLHSRFSHDSSELQRNYILKAIEYGENTLGFSEHYDYDAVLDGEDIAPADCKLYAENLSSLRNEYPEMTLLYGIELGYRGDAEAHYAQLLEKYPFDYVICSVHTLPGYGDFYHGKVFAERELQDIYDDYFDAVLKSVTSGLDFQIVGHIGYCERNCTQPEGRI